MDPNAIVSLVGSLGFPIVCCIALFWMINTTMKDLKKSIEQNTQATIELATTVKTFHKAGDGEC